MSRRNEFTINVDKSVGNKIREQRLALGLSRMQLAVKIDITHQQLQKYEKGTNRVSAGRLALIAEVMNKPISFFFEPSPIEPPTHHQRMCIELSRNFMLIENPDFQTAIHMISKILAGVGHEQDS